jgi:DDE superfamily endonuclease
MAGTTSDWRDELGHWLRPFLDRLGHKARRQMCPLYVAGLIGPGDRKSVQPMAERFAPGDYDQLHHFVSAGVWDAAPLEAELLIQADRVVGGSNAMLVIDDTAVPKKGQHSVGVAPQYASSLGKTASCQTLVSLTLARGEVPVMVALRLFLPENWTNDRRRLERAGVPVEYRTARTKPEIALAEIDRIIASGVRFGCVLADAGYGLSAPFRQGLTARKLAWAVGIPRHLKVYPVGVQLIWPIATRGRPRNGISQIFYQSRPKTCWPMPSGRTSAGEPAQKESSKPALRLFVCGSPTDRRSGSGTRVSSIFPVTRPGSSANTECQERRNTISPTYPPRWTCEPWLPPSRRDGSASRPISS